MPGTVISSGMRTPPQTPPKTHTHTHGLGHFEQTVLFFVYRRRMQMQMCDILKWIYERVAFCSSRRLRSDNL